MAAISRSVHTIRRSGIDTASPSSLSRVAYWVSGALALVAALAAGATFFIPGLLRGPAVMNGSARGTALVVLGAAVPILVASMWFASRSSIRALVTWLGAIVYILYNSLLFLFATPFNRLFLLYVAMLSLALWSLATLVSQIDLEAFKEQFSPRLPRRALAAYALVIVGLNTLAWLAQVVPASFSASEPAFLVGTGEATSVLYAGDLAIWLPLAGVAAVWLWQDRAWGFLILGSILTFYAIEAVGVAVDQLFGHAADPASTIASAAAVPIFAVVALVSLVPLYFYFRNLGTGR